MHHLFTATAITFFLASTTLCAEEWKSQKFDDTIQIKAPVELTPQSTGKGKVFIGIEISPLPNPKFTTFALAVIPLSEEEKTLPEKSFLKNTAESALDNKLNRELTILSSTEKPWRGIKIIETQAESRFVALPYIQLHIDRSFIKDGVRYTLSSSQLMQNTNQIAISQFGQRPTAAQLEQERSRIRRDAGEFFDSFECKAIPELSPVEPK